MSTNFYPLEPPVTAVAVRHEGVHDRIGVFLNHALCGELVVRSDSDEGSDFLRLLSARDPVAHRSVGPNGVLVLSVYREVEGQIMEESGRLTTLERLRREVAEHNSKQKPTP